MWFGARRHDTHRATVTILVSCCSRLLRCHKEDINLLSTNASNVAKTISDLLVVIHAQDLVHFFIDVLDVEVEVFGLLALDEAQQAGGNEHDIRVRGTCLKIKMSKGWRPRTNLTVSTIPAQATRREWYQICGEMYWHARLRVMSGQQKGVVRKVWVDVAPKLLPEADDPRARSQWREVVEVPGTMRENLEALRELMVKADKVEDYVQLPPQKEVEEVYYVISDAWPKGTGFIVLDENFSYVHHEHEDCEPDHQTLQEGRAMLAGA